MLLLAATVVVAIDGLVESYGVLMYELLDDWLDADCGIAFMEYGLFAAIEAVFVRAGDVFVESLRLYG